jgi:Cu-processing system ATP-binding protein
MLKFENVSKSYGKIPALNNISFEINKGESVAIVGPNGSGKTTLIKSIMGLVKTDSGKILFDNKNIENEYEYRSEIGYMPQIGRYPDNLTPNEIIKFIQTLRNTNFESNIKTIVEEFELTPHIDKKMRALSGGTRQKVSAILTFMFNPELYILDEPTAGLDPLTSIKFKNYIKQRNYKEKTIIIVSHLISEIEEIAKRLIYIMDGNILLNDSIENLKNYSNENDLATAILKIIERMKNENQ